MSTVEVTREDDEFVAVHDATGTTASGSTEVLALLRLAASLTDQAAADNLGTAAGSSEITLKRGDHGWIARDEHRDVTSAPMPTRAEALDDLDENLALESGELVLSEDASDAIEATAGELEENETVAHDELKRELGLE